MPNISEQLEDFLTAHSIDINRLEAGTVRKLEGVMNGLLDKLSKNLRDNNPTGPARVVYRNARAKVYLEAANQDISRSYEQMEEILGKDLYETAKLEAKVTADEVNRLVNVDLVSGKLTPEQLNAITQEENILKGERLADWFKVEKDAAKRIIRSTVSEGVALGTPIDDMVRSIIGTKAANYRDGIGRQYKNRVRTIVRTAVNATANNARNQVYDNNEDVIKGKQWMSTLDTRTSNQCFTGEMPVIPFGLIKKVFRRRYDGDMFIITTSSGKEIVATPNHPILTTNGWLPVKEINPANEIIYSVSNNGLCVMCADNIGVIPTFAEFFDACGEPSISTIDTRSASTDDFHGDGYRGDDKINIASIDSDLRNRFITGSFDHLGDRKFRLIQFAISLNTQSSLHQRFSGQTIMSLSSESDSISFKGGEQPALTSADFYQNIFDGSSRFIEGNAPSDFIRGSDVMLSSADILKDTKTFQEICDSSSRNVILPCQCCGRFSVSVTLENVISMRLENRSTHVYNLETSQGIYNVSSIIVKNCIALDGASWDMEGNPINGTTLPWRGPPPAHPNCRSVLLPIVKSWSDLNKNPRIQKKLEAAEGKIKPSTRANIDGLPVPVTTNYEKWLKGQSKTVQLKVLGPTKRDLWQKGQLSLSKLIDQSHRPLTVEELKAKYVPLESNNKRFFSGNSWYERHTPAELNAKDIIGQLTPDEQVAFKRLGDRVSKIVPTHKLYRSKAGGWQKSRVERFHKKIMDKYINPESIKRATPRPGEKPQYVMFGGRGGSGKSAFTRLKADGGLEVVNKDNFIYLDTDEIKSMLPGYKGWNAFQFHEESSDLFDAISKIARAKGLNIIHDMTLKTQATAIKRAKLFKAKGYDINGYYMFLPPQKAAQRAVRRALGKTKRFVPPDVVLANTANEKTFDALARKYFRHWEFYDNQGAKPKLIAKSKLKASPEIYDFGHKLHEPFLSSTDYVVKKGTENAVEYAVVFDNAGSTILKKKGGSHYVNFSNTELDRMRGGNLVHNHPSSRPLSSDDISLASKFNLNMTAVGHDGTTYITQGYKNISRETIREVNNYIPTYIRPMVDSKQLTIEQAEIIHFHVLSEAFKKSGLIGHYRVDNPSDTFSNAIAAIDQDRFDEIVTDLVDLIHITN